MAWIEASIKMTYYDPPSARRVACYLPGFAKLGAGILQVPRKTAWHARERFKLIVECTNTIRRK